MNDFVKGGKKVYHLYSKSKLPASDYVINPYVGCLHGCLYCYACFMGRFTGHTEAWGTYVEPKVFSDMKLPRQQVGKTILIGSVTDAYNPAEKTYCLMPKILGKLKDCKADVEILTKSKLILRDVDIIKQIPKISVGVSLAFSSEKDAADLEPGAAGVQERLNILKSLRHSGISTYLFVAPYFPGITNLAHLVELTDGYVDKVCVENLNLRGCYKTAVLEYIEKNKPKLFSLYQDVYTKGGGNLYWKGLEQEIFQLESQMRIPIVSYLYHEKIKKQ